MHPHPQLSKQSEEFQSMGGHQTPGCCQKTLRWGVDMHGVRTVLPPPQGLNQEIWYSHHGCGCGGTYPKTTVYVPHTIQPECLQLPALAVLQTQNWLLSRICHY